MMRERLQFRYKIITLNNFIFQLEIVKNIIFLTVFPLEKEIFQNV